MSLSVPPATPDSSSLPSPRPFAGRSELAALVQAKDWSQSPLGPIEQWPQSLRTTVSLCLASNFPINIIWGPAHTQIYNDGYRVLCGASHPRALGEAYTQTWASAWSALGEPFERALSGETSFLENQRMFLFRNAYLEETFFTFSLSPIYDESGGIGGLFHPVTELTQQTLAERRLQALRTLAECANTAPTELEAAAQLVSALGEFDLDVPFVALYSLAPEAAQAHLVASAGLAKSPRAGSGYHCARRCTAHRLAAGRGCRAVSYLAGSQSGGCLRTFHQWALPRGAQPGLGLSALPGGRAARVFSGGRSQRPPDAGP